MGDLFCLFTGTSTSVPTKPKVPTQPSPVPGILTWSIRNFARYYKNIKAIMSESDCPLCMETLEIDDLHFYPCTCGYQICRFCWHRIRTDGNGKCPACRKAYGEKPASYRPL